MLLLRVLLNRLQAQLLKRLRQVWRRTSGTSDATRAVAQPALSQEPLRPTLPVAVLLAFHLTFPFASRPSPAIVSSMVVEEWKGLFRQAHPTASVPSVRVMALNATGRAPAVPTTPNSVCLHL